MSFISFLRNSWSSDDYIFENMRSTIDALEVKLSNLQESSLAREVESLSKICRSLSDENKKLTEELSDLRLKHAQLALAYGELLQGDGTVKRG